MTTVAIIGAGFSGLCLALNLMRSGGLDDQLIIIEKGRAFGLGQAYSTQDDTHLLNIPATGMSPFSDQPGAFGDYLREQRVLVPGDTAQLEGFFAPRKIYGRFLRHIVETQLQPGAGRPCLTRIESEAVDIDASNAIRLADGRSVHADRIVLALGNLPPRSLRVIAECGDLSDLHIGDPWMPGGLDAIAPEANVLLIGTGLTTVDCVQSLGARGHKGAIIAVSRHGLLPRRYEPVHVWKPFVDPARRYKVRELVRLVREQIGAAERQGKNWQAVLNSLRSASQALWTGLSPAEQARFIRHIRPFWDVHRHRIAPEVADRVEAMRTSGQLRVLAGHIVHLKRVAEGIDVTIRRRGTQDHIAVPVQMIVNCSGPNYDFGTSDQRLLKRLLASGRIRLNRHKLGLEVDGFFAAVDRDGQAADDLFAMGPMLRGQYWEINAVPEIVAQAEAMAPRLWAKTRDLSRASSVAARA